MAHCIPLAAGGTPLERGSDTIAPDSIRPRAPSTTLEPCGRNRGLETATKDMPRLIALLARLLGASRAHAQASKPSKTVATVAGVSPGGGADRMARLMQKVLQARRLIEVPANVVNHPGGGSTIAPANLQQHAAAA